MELIDIGCNLTHDAFDGDRDAVIEAAKQAGVVQIIVTGASAGGSQAALALARGWPRQLFATTGVHPHRASQYDPETDGLLRELAGQAETVAVGETGLDYFRDFSPREAQRSAFEQQVQIAVDTALPLFLHQRDAHDDFVAILREYRDRLSEVVVHCFTGTRPELHEYLDLDCHVGITGWICDERRGTHMKAFMRDIPADRLMIETDAPYLKPRNLRPKIRSHRNEPRLLPWILGTLAACRDEHPEHLAEATTRNARRFFRLEAPPSDSGLARLNGVGYWIDSRSPASRQDPSASADEARGLPDPGRLLQAVGARPVDQRVIAYLRSGREFAAFLGPSYCRLDCGIDDFAMGCRDLTDGKWVWPEGLVHYVEDHGVPLPPAFLDSMEESGWKVPQDASVPERSGGAYSLSYWAAWSAEAVRGAAGSRE